MNFCLDVLMKTELFQTLTISELNILWEPDSCIISPYKKGSMIMQKNDICRSIGIILEGSLSAQQISPAGETIKIRMFDQGDCFGVAQLYSANPTYPYPLITTSATKILYIPFSKVEFLLRTNATFTTNYITFLSNRIQFFNQKVQILSQKDVRSRLALYLAAESKRAKNLSFPLSHTKTEIAGLIGVARPSLSRELKHMQEDNLLSVKQNMILIKDPDYFSLPSIYD